MEHILCYLQLLVLTLSPSVSDPSLTYEDPDKVYLPYER